MAHTMEELQMRQALPLNLKVSMTKTRIREWVRQYGTSGVYVSFSGGKDSTVLLHLVREEYPDIPAVFVDTGLEYPEIREFVKTFDNVVWLKPNLTFKEVIQKYGYPMFSKEISRVVSDARRFLAKLIDNQQSLGERQANASMFADLVGIERRDKNNRNDFQDLKKGIIPDEVIDRFPAKAKMLFGKYPHRKKGETTNEYSRMYDKSKYLFMLDAPFEISNKCCDVMKKSPAHKYAKETGRYPMTAQMASESALRTSQWLKNGCNGFHMKSPISNPMSFWTEQDILLYIKMNNIPICSVYGDIVEDRASDPDAVEGQMTISDMEGFENMGRFDAERLPLKTTGCQRTGCMFCGFGCHLEKEGEGRFERMKDTHPQVYDYVMRSEKQGGLNYKEVIDWINEHGNMHIRY